MLVTAPMETPLFSCLFSLLILLTAVPIDAVSAQCLSDHQSLLLQLKNELLPVAPYSTKLLQWSPNSDCCSWEGVTCKEGRVTGLDLSNELISAGIENSTLFNLQSLENLDFSSNNFNSTIPARIGNLTSLKYLNLYSSGFTGQIPIEISHLTSLITLHLSTYWLITRQSSTDSNLKLEKPNLFMLIQNLTKLEELYLDGVDMSSTRNQWGEFISSSLPHLRVLSLSYCDISGPIDQSLVNLQALSEIRLDGNNLSSPVPLFFANLSNLVSLSLDDCELHGEFPREIFKLPTLQTLYISGNKLLQGSFPEFPQNNPLQTLVLRCTNFSGPLPTSIDNLRNLSRLDLDGCQFSGTLPNSMVKLTKLVYLDLSLNKFTGSIPSSLFKLSSLEEIYLYDNQFSGKLEFPNPSSSVLASLVLSSNKLEGPIPISIFNLRNLSVLSLSSNKLNDTIELDMFQRLPNLKSLDLSYNSLIVKTSGSHSNLSTFLDTLRLSSCKLRQFPYLKNQPYLTDLDLSNNLLHGEVPNWIWNVGNGSLLSLNLSHNYLVGMQEPYSIPNTLLFLDLHLNQLQGKIPILPPSAWYIDFSSNNFTGSIPSGIGYNLSSTGFFSLSNNSITGVIPESICMASSLEVLDLSKNSLNGRVPECMFTENMAYLGVLNLQKNSLRGRIPNTFSGTCSLKTLDLNGNVIQGQIPKSLANCNELEVLNLGNNNLIDEFPCFLMYISSLRVLVLRSNKLYGSIECLNASVTWPMLQIFDLAHNNFSGKLPEQSFAKWKAMMGGQGKFVHLGANYIDSIIISSMGLEMNLVKILTILTYIDLSSNNFDGPIPKEIGELTSLYSLNLSNNSIMGVIPESICMASHLEVLDLSKNSLNGKVPECLSKNSYLGVLNLQNNRLSGPIPNTFLGNCSLKTLDLNGNMIEGQIPKSLANCYELEVLNLGNNNLIDEFPCLLMNISSLRVLVLRSNKLYGSIECLNANVTWAMLQIFDLAHNNFNGKLPGQSLEKWKAMMGREDNNTQPKLNFLQVQLSGANYIDSVTVTIKGLEMNLVKILTILTSIDLSSNKFDGPIPKEIGELTSLYSLNLSSNSLLGKMPTSLGNLQLVESLDLSRNHLTGNIPPSLTKLNFLSHLNLSFNQLVGSIPSGSQIQTFSADSFLGNEGLCGLPLIQNCTDGVAKPKANYSDDGSEIDWGFLSVEIGFIVGFGILVGPLVFCRRWRKWYFECVDEIAFKICPLSIWRFYYRRQLASQNKRRRH
ncbi:hypothetical protein UlMin_000741 [Ulmus minor]